MKDMLFRKDIEKQCGYCAHAAKVNDSTYVCVKRGVVNRYGSCRRFQYDPLKRVPEPQPKLQLPKFDSEDYTL